MHFYDPTPQAGRAVAGQRNAALSHGAAGRLEEGRVAARRDRTTVVVEASQWVEDNQWILDLAAKEKSIVGFIGNLDPTDANFSANLKRFAAQLRCSAASAGAAIWCRWMRRRNR